MATPRQMMIQMGFKELPRNLQTSDQFVYFGIREGDEVVARAGISSDWLSGLRGNCREVVVFVAGKRRRVLADYDDTRMTYKALSDAQNARLQGLLEEAVAAGPAPKKPAKPRPQSPMKGKTLSEEQKSDNRVWRHLGYLTCVGFVDKDLQERLQYVKGGKFIRLEDLDCVMAYANIRDADLAVIDMTVADLEKFLIGKGVKRKVQKRVKRSYSLYD